MCRLISYVVALSMISLILHNAAEAQTTCPNAQAMGNVNHQQFMGTWYEVARKPSLTNMSCIEVDLGLTAEGKNVQINVTYVDPQEKQWKNLTMTSNTSLSSNSNNNGFQIQFSSGGQAQPVTTLKLLNTDYQNYALVCGYTNPNDQNTIFSAVLTRLRMPTEANLLSYEKIGSNTFANFDGMANVTQSEKCYKSGATAPIPVIAAMLMAACTLLKYIY